MRGRPGRGLWVSLWLALPMLVLATAAHSAAPPTYTQVTLLGLPHQGALSSQPVTLAELAAKYQKLDGAASLLVYVCSAGVPPKPPLPTAAVTELEALSDVHWADRPEGRVVPLAVIAVPQMKADALGSVSAAIQTALAGAPNLPLYVDLGGQLLASLQAEKGPELVLPPPVFLMSTTDLSIPAWRGSAPVRADIWFGLQGKAKPASALPDPPGVPADCTDSWFRRSIARVVQAGVMALDDQKEFHPQETVTETEFAGWLAALAPARVADALGGYDPAHPKTVTRERALAAMVQFLWGNDPAAILAASPPPAGRSGASTAKLWQQAFHDVPGSEDVTPALAPSLAAALAKGLLYFQPALDPQGALTREVAAWLLDHGLPSAPGDPTGVVVDVVDLPFMVDSTGTSSRGAGLFAPGEGPDDTPRQVYPGEPAVDRLPGPDASFPSISCVPWTAPEQAASEEDQRLASRVGERPLEITAERVLGESDRGRQVLITPGDAKKLRWWNDRNGLLDNWHVAFRYGVGARLLTPLDGPIDRETAFIVRFSQEMSQDTASSDHVWLRQASDHGTKVAAVVAWRQPGRELSVRPEAPLAPNQEYELALAKDLYSARGQPIAVRDEPLAAAGLARCWRFTTDPRLRVYVGISGVPDGTKVYLPERPDFLVTPLDTSPLVLVKPGPLEVRFETPDGGSFTERQQVTEDGAIRLPTTPSPASQAGAPAEVAPGQSWSPTERHLLPPIARGARDVQLTPRFRRWLAVGSTNEVRVVDSDGNAFTRLTQVPGRPGNREFWVDDLGVLHFAAEAAGTMVDVSYQYQAPRCAVITLGLPEDDPLHQALETALRVSLQNLGYEEVPATDLTAAWPTGDLTSHLASAEEVQTAMGALGLTDLFVLTLDTALDGGYQGAWTIWTAESGLVTKWPPVDPDGPAMHLRRGRRTGAAMEASYARREVVQSLRPWLALKGMEPSDTLAASPSD